MTGLAVYQWLELLSVRAGHKPTCAVNETVDCTAVWNSPFASRLHELLGIPVAGMGVVWGLAALGLLALLTARPSNVAAITAVRGWALVGALSCVVFAVASFGAGALCLTCMGTYVLVLAFCAVALKASTVPLLPPGPPSRSAAGWMLAFGAAAYLLALYPGSKTSNFDGGGLSKSSGKDSNPIEVFKTLTDEERKMLDEVRSDYRQTPAFDTSMFKARVRKGPVDAKMKVIDFTDILCSHCRALVTTMAQIEKLAPPGQLTVEARYYPLDGECNAQVSRTVGDGLRCLGAKALICLEGTPEYWSVREKLFEAQTELDKERIMRIVTSTGMSRGAMEACVGSSETKAKLDEDIKYATLFNIQGTPLVLINGKPTPPYGPFLLGMALAQGNVDSPVFSGKVP
jgi:serine/threonine-protein kinase